MSTTCQANVIRTLHVFHFEVNFCFCSCFRRLPADSLDIAMRMADSDAQLVVMEHRYSDFFVLFCFNFKIKIWNRSLCALLDAFEACDRWAAHESRRPIVASSSSSSSSRVFSEDVAYARRRQQQLDQVIRNDRNDFYIFIFL